MDNAKWTQKIDDYIASENAKAGMVLPVHRIFCQDGTDRSGGGIYNETVTVDTIGRFARALGDSNPLYSNPRYAERTSWHGIVAPPLTEACIVSTFVAGSFPRVRFMSVFDAGTKWERFAPIRPGDMFRAENTYLGVRDLSKEPQTSRVLLRSHAIALFNQYDQIAAVVTARTIIKCVSPKAAGAIPKKPKIKAETRRFYSDNEIEKLYENLDAQFDGKFRRGGKPRYWEDVKIGDGLPEEIVGPYDEADARSLFAAIGTANAFATKSGNSGRRARMIHDPKTGAVRDPLDRHMSDAIAQVQGSPRAIVPGIHSQALLAKSISDWMGDAGVLVSLDCQCRHQWYFGDLSIQNGAVIDKYQKGKQNYVKIKIKAARQDGVVHTEADAIVRLPSRQTAAVRA